MRDYLSEMVQVNFDLLLGLFSINEIIRNFQKDSLTCRLINYSIIKMIISEPLNTFCFIDQAYLQISLM